MRMPKASLAETTNSALGGILIHNQMKIMFNNSGSNNNNNNIENISTATNTDNSPTVMLSNQTTSTNANATSNTTGTIPKEKSSKTTKHQQPRKPPPTVDTFWPSIMQEVQSTAMVDAKHQALPLARIKKIMKLDENAKMIAAEAPLLFAKACEFFIQELTMRAWIHTDESKRRTLQRSDIAQAIANYDQFDFLIDIVPREDIKPSSHRKTHNNDASSGSAATNTTTNTADTTAPADTGTAGGIVTTNQPTTATTATTNNSQPATQVLTTSHPTQQLQIIHQPATHPQQQHMQYFITLPGQQTGQAQLVHQLQLQQHQQQLPQNTIATPLTATSLNLVAQQPQQLILTAANPNTQSQQQQLLQNLVQQQQQQQQSNQPQQQQVQLLQQVVVTPNGEVTNMPIAINANQLQLLRLQMQQQQQQQQHHHHQQQQQQTQAAPQQVIIPTQLLTAQQILQLQQNHANGANGATTAHIVHHQQPQQHHHGQSTNTIYINASNPSANVQATASMVSTDRNMANTFRNNC